MARILVVSHRLPVTVSVADGKARIEPSSGGLATGLGGAHQRSGGLWIGYPGDVAGLDEAARAALDRQLGERGLVPVVLERDAIKRYYEGFCNGVLWPLFHYLPYRMPLEVRDWDAYEDVNARFADTVAAHYRPGDVVWVHDYQLLLVPELLRLQIPEARIGFFLHIPFPASEMFRVLPERERILTGMLGADLVGFHIAAYMRHFASSLLQTLAVDVRFDHVEWESREIRLGVFPMGVDAAHYAATANSPSVTDEVRALRGEPGTRLLLGVDRLDYTKGIPRRLLAFERLLERHPELRERVRLVQVGVPSREDIDAYQTFRSETEELIGRIHGAFATARWVPVHWMYRALAHEEIVTLYRAADVMLVTPLRDGMNLVAKEFIASRTDEDGVLVLSEFAGAAAELAEAIQVNPFDVSGSADAYYRALELPAVERRARMRALRRRVLAYDVHRWTQTFLHVLQEEVSRTPSGGLALTPWPAIARIAAELRSEPHLALLLDYDGTLVPFTPRPELAEPDAPLVDLLAALAARPRTVVHVVSGRTRETLERWLGMLPIGLHAEHGFWSRLDGTSPWQALTETRPTWLDAVRAILEDFAARTPGSLVEQKTVGLAWHYRAVDPELAARHAGELLVHLSELLSNVPVEVVPGDKVIEVRPHGVSKARMLERVMPALAPETRIAALGDDRTDEDLFAALPSGAAAIHVGPNPSHAPIRLRDVAAARRFLRTFVA